MNPSFSAILNCSRWLATGAVVLYHVRFLLFASYDQVHDKGFLVKLYYFVTSLGHEGFVLYMVASGMLLGGLSLRRWTRQGQNAWRDVVHKAVWFYALLVPGLLIGGALDIAGSCVLQCTGVYGYFGQFNPDFSLVAVSENLLPLQRFMVPGLGSNAMLYLLAYECWAYLALAGFMLPGRRPLGVLAGLAIAAEGVILAPEFFGYLALWMLGALLYRHREQLSRHIPLGLAVAMFAVTLLTSRVLGARLSQEPAHFVLVMRTLLDLQFGLGLMLLLLALSCRRREKRVWPLLLWRLNRFFPSANSVILASHFPFMMFLVAVTSHSLAVPIAGQPRTVVFVLFGVLVVAIYAYAWLLSRLALRLVRLLPRRGGLPGAVAPA